MQKIDMACGRFTLANNSWLQSSTFRLPRKASCMNCNRISSTPEVFRKLCQNVSNGTVQLSRMRPVSDKSNEEHYVSYMANEGPCLRLDSCTYKHINFTKSLSKSHLQHKMPMGPLLNIRHKAISIDSVQRHNKKIDKFMFEKHCKN